MLGAHRKWILRVARGVEEQLAKREDALRFRSWRWIAEIVATDRRIGRRVAVQRRVCGCVGRHKLVHALAVGSAHAAVAGREHEIAAEIDREEHATPQFQRKQAILTEKIPHEGQSLVGVVDVKVRCVLHVLREFQLDGRFHYFERVAQPCLVADPNIDAVVVVLVVVEWRVGAADLLARSLAHAIDQAKFVHVILHFLKNLEWYIASHVYGEERQEAVIRVNGNFAAEAADRRLVQSSPVAR